MMRVVLTGATGTIGRALARALLARGDEVVALSRDPRRAREVLGEQVVLHSWPTPTADPPPEAALSGADAVVNLLGEPVAQRWSERAKREIRESRVLGTQSLVAGLRSLPDGERPRALVSQSATGYYGPHGDEPLDEESPPGDDFLAGVVVAWERAALGASELMRVALTRTGVVLSPKGGALAQMLPFFRLGLGGPVAGGHQYIPWVHRDDVVGGLLHCLDHQDAKAAVNLTSPNPVTNAEFSRSLGRALGRPAILPVPGVAIRLLYGEMSQIVTTGQRVLPRRLEQLAYDFRRPDLGPALRHVLRSS